MPTALRISNWDARHECAHSRKCAGPLSWVRVDCQMTGLTTRRILQEPDGPAILGAWLAIVCWCADHPAGRRGWLVSAGEALDADGLALVMGWSPDAISRALEVLTRNDIRWIEEADAGDLVRDGCGMVAGQHPAVAGRHPAGVPQCPAVAGLEERRGEKNTPPVLPLTSFAAKPPQGGETAIEEQETVSPSEKSKAPAYVSRHPPTEEAWVAYADSLRPPMPRAEAIRARNHYEANGWRVGKNPMRDWKAAVRTCHSRWLESGGVAAKRSEPLLIAGRPEGGSW